MLKQKRAATLAATIATTLFLLPVTASQRISLNEALDTVTDVAEGNDKPETQTEVELTWKGKGFTPREEAVLKFLQERGITDRAALATILGNIKQESRFDTIVCEGGRRTGYHNCYSGGFGQRIDG